MWPQHGAGPTAQYVRQWCVIDEHMWHTFIGYTSLMNIILHSSLPMNIVYYIHLRYIPGGFCWLTDKFKLNSSVSWIHSSVLTKEYFVVSYSVCGLVDSTNWNSFFQELPRLSSIKWHFAWNISLPVIREKYCWLMPGVPYRWTGIFNSDLPDMGCIINLVLNRCCERLMLLPLGGAQEWFAR
jgi:hypothetical protein